MARPVPVRGLTEGAVLAVVVAILALMATYIPLAGAAAFFLCPLPLTVLTVRHGLRVALLAAAVATGIGTMVGGILIGSSITLAFAPIGLAMGIGIRRGLSSTGIWLLTAAVAAVSTIASALLALFGIGQDPRRLLAQVVEESVRNQQSVVQLYERLGISTADVRQAVAQTEQLMRLLPWLLPFLLIGSVAMIAYLNLLVGRPVLRRLRIDVPAFPPLSTWRVPSWFVWTLPVGMLSLILSGAAWPPRAIPEATLRVLTPDHVAAIVGQAVVRYPLLQAAGMNLVMLAQAVFSPLGLITGWVLMERYNVTRWYRWFLIFLAVTSPMLTVVALLLGLADATYDLRSRWRQTAAASPTPASNLVGRRP